MVEKALVDLNSQLSVDCLDFLNEHFDVDSFIVKNRRKVTLENLKKDLQTVSKYLKNAVVETVNANYTEYVSLSTNLVGHDRDMAALKSSFSTLSSRFESIIKRVDMLSADVDVTAQKLDRLANSKDRLRRSRHILITLDKLETLHASLLTEGQSSPNYIHSFERLCCNWADLQWHLTTVYSELPIVTAQKDRISRIVDSIQTYVERLIVNFVQSNANKDLFVSCLQILAFFNRKRFVEDVIRRRVCRPYLQEVLIEDRLQSSGLETLFSDLLTFLSERIVPIHILAATIDSMPYDFVARSFWVEFVAQLDAPNLRSLFTVADPTTFHYNYKLTLRFVKQVEDCLIAKSSTLAPSSVRPTTSFRETQAYEQLMSKWNLAVYYQLRFQEICGRLEIVLKSTQTSFSTAKPGDFWLDATKAVKHALFELWSEETVFIAALSHRFWKLTLLILHRYAAWIHNQADDSKHRQPQQQQQDAPSSLLVATYLMADWGRLQNVIEQVLIDVIFTLTEATSEGRQILKDALKLATGQLNSAVSTLMSVSASNLANECALPLKHIQDVPRFYRKMNREAPTKPSHYVSLVAKPLEDWNSKAISILDQSEIQYFLQTAANALLPGVLSAVRDQLQSVRVMEESLRRLQNRRQQQRHASSQSLQSGALSDDDKIRLQLKVDVEILFEKLTALDIKVDSDDATQLLQLFSNVNLQTGVLNSKVSTPRTETPPPIISDGVIINNNLLNVTDDWKGSNSDLLTMNAPSSSDGNVTNNGNSDGLNGHLNSGGDLNGLSVNQ